MLADLNDLNPNEVLKQRLSRKQMDGYQANRRIDAGITEFYIYVLNSCWQCYALIQ